ncbi:MAG: hypothetical protein K2K46_01640 [Lachnospiraceae bacterium]|nr:hypothetical protein [Lachnospiraceae bacterium]
MKTLEKKKGRGYWIFLLGWSVLLTVVMAAALIWFYGFLKDYQRVFDETRPLLYQNKVMEIFTARDAEQILEQAEPVELGPFESRENYISFLNDYLSGKSIDFGTKAGEHIEERPVYVITADETPFAVVRLKKKSETASYGLPLWETGSIELLPMTTKEYELVAPSAVTVTVNGITVTEDALEESGIRGTAEEYLEAYTQIPSYSQYDLGQFYGEPEIYGTNEAGEPVDISYDEKEHCYRADFGGNEILKEEVEDYVIQAVTDYAMYVSNDMAYNSLDKYFPAGSKLLMGIKSNQRQWYDDHRRPEVKNQKITEFTVYSEDAFSAQVYLEQHMYVDFSKNTEVVVTDLHVYFVKIDGAWKVAGIAF